MKKITEPYHIFDDPMRYYSSMLEDIESARYTIYLQTYRVGNDSIGIKFRDALTKKASQGIKVKILIDSWGGNAIPDYFFKELIAHKGEVRYFEKLKFNFDFFTKGHRRNHRKLLIIDNQITYIGSTNITEYNLNWRESVLRLTSDIALKFIMLFDEDWENYNKNIIDKKVNSRMVRHETCEILRDVPSIAIQRINKRYVQLIQKAEDQVLVETPYFLPGYLLRKALMDAAKRGVQVTIILPKHSDVGLVDILRNKYLGHLYKSGINFLFYIPHNLHAKVMLIDDNRYSIGSSNFDYRSFRYMYEIVLLGKDPQIIDQLETHFSETIKNTHAFDYERWLDRPVINKFFEWILLPFRHLL
ncbi:MAG: phosphatidylserine/phosphatidylglycerophosphate/cardiolipin synthase family protein [Bacteroidetes bacterium]|nr:phosphatidylserine/phosphatidylglycerophosphate/cardiolipin synthase family protein [Bacteroidota bacterium]